jgi:conjugative transfer pilus assembly protein TraH
MLKYIIAAVLIVTSPIVSAGIMADMKSMFMSNSTAPTTISTKDRTGVFGGSFNMRTPIQSVNIVSFDPPRLDAGCGGVDLYGGSFTFISANQLMDLFRHIASASVGLAFKAAIDAISPDLGKLMTEFQTLMQKMNNLAKNSCNMAHLLTDGFDKEISSAVGGDATTNNVVNNQITDWTASLAKYNADPNSFVNSAAHLNPKAGNGNMKAVVASGTSSTLGTIGIPNYDSSTDDATDPNSLNNRVLLSLIGFEVHAISCSVNNQAGTPNTSSATPGTGLTQMDCSGHASITLDSLINGGGAGSASPDVPLTLWRCMNPTGSTTSGINTDAQICTQMQSANFTYVGIKGYVNNMLFGTGDTATGNVDPNSIVGIFNSGANALLSHDQIGFIKQSGVPIIGLFTKTSDPNARVAIAARLEPYISSCIAAKVGSSLYSSLNGMNTVVGFTVTDDSKKHLADLRTDYLKAQDVCNRHEALTAVASELNVATMLYSGKVK